LAEDQAIVRYPGALHRAADLALASGNLPVSHVDIGDTFGEFERRFETVGKARLNAFAHHDAVDDNLDVMLVFLVERGRLFDLVEGPVDADAGEALLLPLREFLPVLALAAAHDGGKQIGARAL